VLDLYNELRDAVRGHAVGATPREVNERLHEVFDWIEFDPGLDGSGRRAELPEGAVRLRAYVSDAFLATRVDPEDWAVVESTVERPKTAWGIRDSRPSCRSRT
jgi:hypothetical protein